MATIYENQMASVGSMIARGIILLIIGVLLTIFTATGMLVLSIIGAIFLIIIGISLIGGSTMFQSTGARVVGIILGILLILCGIAAIIWPTVFANIITYIIGVVAAIAGIYELVAGIVGGNNRVNRPLQIICGIISILFGAFIFFWPLFTESLVQSVLGPAFGVTWLIGIFLIVYGIIILIAGIVMKVKIGKAAKVTAVKDN